MLLYWVCFNICCSKQRYLQPIGAELGCTHRHHGARLLWKQNRTASQSDSRGQRRTRQMSAAHRPELHHTPPGRPAALQSDGWSAEQSIPGRQNRTRVRGHGSGTTGQGPQPETSRVSSDRGKFSRTLLTLCGYWGRVSHNSHKIKMRKEPFRKDLKQNKLRPLNM